jgi:hypothetical protein
MAVDEVGEPIQAGAVRLAPVVRVRRMRRPFTPGDARQASGGMALMSASPVAVQVLDGAGGRTVRVPNPMQGVWLSLLISLIMMPLLRALVVRLARGASQMRQLRGA